MNKKNEYIKLISLTWDEVVIAYNLMEMSRLEIESVKPEKKVIAKSDEFIDIGRIRLKDLTPATEYTIIVKWKGGTRQLKFRTLAEPVGKLISSFAILADPHISEKIENRKGRLFIESASILSDIVIELNDLNVDFTLVAGDMTNKGTIKEYQTVSSILQALKKPLLAVPGDHDVQTPEQVHLWGKYFGELQWNKTIKEYCITGVNTAKNQIDLEGYALVQKNLKKREYIPIILSHMQFIENSVICIGTKQRTISNTPEARKMVELLKNKKSIIYAGHQNIPAKIEFGKSLQLNVPQPCQYFCGYYLVRHYKNGLYHTLMPIKSEILQQYSRQASNAAALLYTENQWCEGYREGGGLEIANFVY